MSDTQYTAGEQARRAALAARGCWRIVRGRSTGRVDNAFDRITDKAADRTERDARAAFTALDAAKDEVARAKNAERRSRGDEKPAARKAHRDAQDALRRAERAARRYQ